MRVKRDDFEAFATIVRLLRGKEHLVADGFERVVRLAYGMNANGKQRSRSLDEIIPGGILRDYTPSIADEAMKI